MLGKNLDFGISPSKQIQGGLHSHHKLTYLPRYQISKNKTMDYEQIYDSLVRKGKAKKVETSLVAEASPMLIQQQFLANDRKTII